MHPRGTLTADAVGLLALMKTADHSTRSTPAGVRNPCAWVNFGNALRTRDLRRSSAVERSLGEATNGPLAPWPTAGRPLGSVRRPSRRRGTFMLSGKPKPRPQRQQQQPQQLQRRRASKAASLAYHVDGERTSLGDDARQALARGDVYGALLLLEERQIGTTEAGSEARSDQDVIGDQGQFEDQDRGKNQGEGEGRENGAPGGGGGSQMASPRAAHAKLVQLLWRAGHEEEALEAFDLASTRAREASVSHQQQQQASPRRAPPAKHGAGIPGLFLDLDPETCHGIMRRKLEKQDWLGVIEAMRAASRVPRTGRVRGSSISGGDSLSQKGEGREGGVGGGGRAAAALVAGGYAGKLGWAPTEETYALALEACAKVQKRWGFKAALILIQEMRDAEMDIALVHYRAAVTACSLTRQLAGVLPLLEEMNTRGVAADLATYNAAISACTVPKVKRALNLVQMMRSEGVAPTEITYNVVLRLCGLGGCWAMGLELLGMMEDEGLTPNLYHFNSLFKALEHAERWREAASLFRKMRSLGLRPNATTYGPLIGVMDRCDKQDMAAAVLKEMLADSPRDSTRAYNLLLNACAKARRWESAQSVFQDMHDKGVEPDMVSYNTVINALGRCGRVQEAMEYLHRMKEQGLSPDVVTFGTLIHACAQSARKDAALALFAEMASRGLKPNLDVYKGCIVSCHKAGDYQQGLDLFDKMSARHVRMDRVVFNTAIACCSQLKLWRRAVALLDEMRARGVNPDQYSYNSAIYACVKAKQSQQMTMVLARMREDGFNPDVWTYSNLIRCLADANLWRRALGILDDMMEEGGVEPDAHCFNGAISACSKSGEWAEAERLVTEMRSRALKLDPYTYNSLMNAYGVAGEWSKALSMLDQMRDGGVKINGMAYSGAIKACDKGAQWERALELLDRMQERDGTKPNLFAYNHAMSACYSHTGERRGEEKGPGTCGWTAKNDDTAAVRSRYENGIKGDWYSHHTMLVALSKKERWEEAVAMFEDMKRSADTRPDVSCYVTMLYVCESAGFSKQALEYLKEMPSTGTRPSLRHFKQALKACENATQRALRGGRGSGGGGGGGEGAAVAMAAVGSRGGGRQGWETEVAGAVAAVPEIFELIREMELSPDDDCYATAMRACHNAGMGDTASELIDDLQASSAVKRLEQYMPPSSLSPSSSQATDVADVTDASDATQAGLDERGINGDVGGGEGGGGEDNASDANDAIGVGLDERGIIGIVGGGGGGGGGAEDGGGE
eukprot:jgi/Undpi1/8747/HiC_scaffold_25.g11209.m1